MFKPLDKKTLAMFVPQIYPLEMNSSHAKQSLFKFKIKNKQ